MSITKDLLTSKLWDSIFSLERRDNRWTNSIA